MVKYLGMYFLGQASFFAYAGYGKPGMWGTAFLAWIMAVWFHKGEKE